jgi:hypothetical protein
MTAVAPRALLLLASLVALAPLAHASPPDQTSVGGIYDGADLDDVVQMATAIEGRVPDSLGAVATRSLPPAESCWLGGSPRPACPRSRWFLIRAPPARGHARSW